MFQIRKYESVITLTSLQMKMADAKALQTASISYRNGKTIGGVWKKKKEILMEDLSRR